jgi:hypothetical protein
MTENYTWEETTGNLSIRETKPNYNITFNRDNKQVGVLDFNGPEMTFSGDMDESAKAFLDWVANAFKGRLDQERADEREQGQKWFDAVTAQHKQAILAEREACAKVCEQRDEEGECPDQWDWHSSDYAAAIRARGNT